MDYESYRQGLHTLLKITTRNVGLAKEDLPILMNEAYTEIMSRLNPVWVWRKYELSETDAQGSIYRQVTTNESQLNDEITILRDLGAFDNNGNFVREHEVICQGKRIKLWCKEVSVLQSVMYPMEQCNLTTLLRIKEAIRLYVASIVFESTAGQKGQSRQEIAISMYNAEIGRLKDDIPEFKWCTNIKYGKLGVEYAL